MNNPRANIANLIAAGGAALLILSLFLTWFDVGDDEGYSGWKIFTLADIVLFLIALAALALGAAGATGNAAKLPNFLRPSILKWLGAVALTIALAFTIELTSGEFGEGIDMSIGAILGVLSAAAILAGGILSDRPDLAAKLNDATANIGSGGGQPGVGAGPGAGQGGFGGQPGGGAAAPGPGPSAQPQQPQSPPQQPQAQPQTAPQPAQTPSAQPAQGGGESGGPAPGWYPDPQGQKRLRYWDGGRWTEQTSD